VLLVGWIACYSLSSRLVGRLVTRDGNFVFTRAPDSHEANFSERFFSSPEA